jgi:transposase
MFKVPHQVYTAEFKEAPGQRENDGQGATALARQLCTQIPNIGGSPGVLE